MGDTLLSMLVAVPPGGMDPSAFYATFSGKLTGSWSPAEGLVVRLAAEAGISRLHAPVTAAMRFAAAGSFVDDTLIEKDTLILHTWPSTYISVVDKMTASLPSVIHVENVDRAAVRNAVQSLYAVIGGTDIAVNAFMNGNGLLKVSAGAVIGAAAALEGSASSTTPNGVRLSMEDAEGRPVNPVQFLSEAAEQLQVDKDEHPLLSQLDLEGWVEVLVVDADGSVLAGEPYELHLSDGTKRMSETDGEGRLYEIGIPAGPWGLRLANYPSFEILIQ